MVRVLLTRSPRLRVRIGLGLLLAAASLPAATVTESIPVMLASTSDAVQQTSVMDPNSGLPPESTWQRWQLPNFSASAGTQTGESSLIAPLGLALVLFRWLQPAFRPRR